MNENDNGLGKKVNQNSLFAITSIHFTNAELVRTVQITPRQKMKKVE